MSNRPHMTWMNQAQKYMYQISGMRLWSKLLNRESLNAASLKDGTTLRLLLRPRLYPSSASIGPPE